MKALEQVDTQRLETLIQEFLFNIIVLFGKVLKLLIQDVISVFAQLLLIGNFSCFTFFILLQLMDYQEIELCELCTVYEESP